MDQKPEPKKAKNPEGRPRSPHNPRIDELLRKGFTPSQILAAIPDASIATIYRRREIIIALAEKKRSKM